MAYDPIRDYIDPVMHQAAYDVGNLFDIVEYNNALARAETQEARDWNLMVMERANEFNSAEAATQRRWARKLSDTAHQREVADLIKAGLNPVLSANNGATVPSGAAASSQMTSSNATDLDQSGATAIGSLINSIIQADASIKNTNVSALTQSKIAEQSRAVSVILQEMNNATQKAINAANLTNNRYLGELSAEVALRNAELGANATIESAHANAAATRYSAEQAANASKYGSLMNYKNSRDNPQSWAGLASRTVNEFLDLMGMLMDPNYQANNSYWNTQNPGYLP